MLIPHNLIRHVFHGVRKSSRFNAARLDPIARNIGFRSTDMFSNALADYLTAHSFAIETLTKAYILMRYGSQSYTIKVTRSAW